MSKMVSARVPDAVFEQASVTLQQLGATTSELVTAASEYVLQEKQLPVSGSKAAANETRKLSAQKARQIASALQACTLNIDVPSETSYDKTVAAAERSAKYEALA